MAAGVIAGIIALLWRTAILRRVRAENARQASAAAKARTLDEIKKVR